MNRDEPKKRKTIKDWLGLGLIVWVVAPPIASLVFFVVLMLWCSVSSSCKF